MGAGRNARLGLFSELTLCGFNECKNLSLNEKVSEICHGYDLYLFKADSFNW